jgi:hypothetical protein
MVVTQGYDVWLSKENRLEETEEFWSKLDRKELIEKILEHKPESVVEFCCGTGWIPYDLPLQIKYLGIDKNEGCIERAKGRNPGRAFWCQDVRETPRAEPFDMALGFSCLKHFQLADWDQVYGKILQAGKRTLTTVFLRPEDVEEQRHPYIHTAVSMEHMERVIEENGHKLVQVFTLPPLNTMKEPLVLTEAIDGTGLVSTEGLRESGSDERSGLRGVPLREDVLGGVQSEAGDPSGESPDAGEGGDGEGPPEGRGSEWLS